jgi:hypothetical protein
MVNRHRGEVEIEADGRRWTLCLTLGALAELEGEFGAGDLRELVARLTSGSLRAGELAAVLHAALRGGGHEIGRDEVSQMRIAGGLPAAVSAVGELIAAAFGAPDAGKTRPRP